MKTTLYIYLLIWLLIVLPLILFNMKKMFPFLPVTGRKVSIKALSVVAAVFLLATVFLYSSYSITITTRYELAAERYITAHAKFLLGKTDAPALETDLKPLLTGREADAFNTLDFGAYGSAQKVEYQVGNWILPKYFQDQEGFAGVEIYADENPVYVFYRIRTGKNTTAYCLRMIRQDDKSWLVDYFGPATDAEYNVGKKELPKGDKWYVIE